MLLADELQVHVQADVPDVALQRVKLVSFDLGDESCCGVSATIQLTRLVSASATSLGGYDDEDGAG